MLAYSVHPTQDQYKHNVLNYIDGCASGAGETV